MRRFSKTSTLEQIALDFLCWRFHSVYRTTSVRAPFRIVRTPYTRKICPMSFLNAFGQVRYLISVIAISNQGFPAQKCQESQEIAQNQRAFFIKKLFSFIVRVVCMHTNRGSTAVICIHGLYLSFFEPFLNTHKEVLIQTLLQTSLTLLYFLF